MTRRVFSAIAFGLFLSACSGRNQDTGNGATPRASANVITRQELAGVGGQVVNTYDAVQRLRPSFLRARTIAGATNGSSVQGYAVVYVDGIRKGSPEYLRSIPTTEVSEVRYLNAMDATTRYGMNVPAGVIDVRLMGR